LVKSGNKPTLKIESESKEHGVVPTFNTLAEIKRQGRKDRTFARHDTAVIGSQV